jgi:D-xylose transport system permease protein
VISLVVVAVVFEIQSRYFLSARNLSDLVVEMAVVGIVALGEVFVLSIAEIDLSLGSILGAMAALLAVLITVHGFPWWGAVLLTIVSALCIGALQGYLIAWIRLPSFVVTLAGLLTWLGLQLLILGPRGSLNVFQPEIVDITSVYVTGWLLWLVTGIALVWCMERAWRSFRYEYELRKGILWIVRAAVAVVAVAVLASYRGVPLTGVILLFLVLIAEWILTGTPAGLEVFAVGGNAEASRRAGIDIRRVRMTVFMLSGCLAGVAAIMEVSYGQAASSLTGGGTLLLLAIGAAVIGGTSLFGGIGSAWSALLGALVLTGIANGLDLTNHSAAVKYMVEGGVVVLAVLVDRLLHPAGRQG